MRRVLPGWFLAFGLALILAGCGAAPPAAPAVSQPATQEAEEAMAEEAMAEEAMAEEPTTAPTTAPEPTAAPAAAPTTAPEPTAAPAAARPAWQELPLTDVRTGESFSLASFAGRPILVETMATWCPKCRDQLGRVQAASDMLGDEGPVFVALSVETTLPPAELARYAEANGFTMRFAVITPELLQALAETFGRTITNPPSTPSFVIAPDGSYSELHTGSSSPEEVIARVTAAGGEAR